MSSIINWSQVSRKLTGDRTRLKPNYNGKKYRALVDKLLKKEKEIIDILDSGIN